MSKPIFPPDEAGRMAALRSYAILDSPAEEGFDRITQLAAHLFQVPIALVSLVDTNRQWFKSCFGLAARETSRDIAFCAYAILNDDVFVIPDAMQDARFANNPLVTGEPNIRFYAGAPLRNGDGFNLGTLCIIDTKPREFNSHQCEMLEHLAALVVSEMQVRQSERGYRSLLANSSDIVTILNADGTVVYESPSVERVLGYDPNELNGKSIFDFIHPEDLGRVQAAFGGLLENPEFCPQVEFRWKHKNGSWCFLESLGKNLLHDETIRGVVANSRDVSQRKEIENQRFQAEEALRQSEERFKGAFSFSATGMALVALDGRWMRVNQALCDLLGYTEDELLATDFQSLTFPDDLELDLGYVHQLLAGTRATYELEKRYLHKQGHIVWALLSVALMRDSNGNPLNFISQVQDITERKNAEKALRDSELRKTAILETALDCIISIDHRGCVVEWNPAAEATFGYTKQEAIGEELSELIIPSQFREAHHKGLAHYLATGEDKILGQRLELPAICKDGREITAELAVNRIPVEGPAVFTAYLRDITSRKRDEQSLLAAKIEAEQERENAQRANLAKSQFLSRMSHELRTPLNAILGFGQLLEISALSAPDQQSVHQIMKAGTHLLDLINEVLDISRIESGNLAISLEPVCVREVCVDALDLVKPMAAQRSIIFESNLDEHANTYIAADRQRIKQALLNLLSNAVKYNREGGSVILEISAIADDHLRISVRDTGFGIAPEKMDRLFTPFDRLDAEASEIEGTGIGLALSRRMVEAMNGNLGVQSQPEIGSSFWIDLPQAMNPFPEAAPSLSADFSIDMSTRSMVLYIEDNLLNLQLIQRILSQRPAIKLLSSMQGALGIELARRHRPNLILLDLHLPGMPGEEVLYQLKQTPETCDIPVVVISADATPGQIERLLKAGADAYLTKPFDMPALLRVIDGKIADSEQMATSFPL